MIYFRLIGLQQARDSASDLLSTMLTYDVTNPGKDLFSLFLPTVSRPTGATVRFLATLLTVSDLPESHTPEYVAHIMDVDELDRTHPLRHVLLKWLLPLAEENSDVSTSRAPRDSNPVDIDETLIARVAVALVQRDVIVDFKFNPRPSATEDTEDFDEIEKIYLKSSFIDTNEFENADEIHAIKKKSKQNVIRVESLEKVLLELLEQCCRHVLDNVNSEVRFFLFRDLGARYSILFVYFSRWTWRGRRQ